MTPEKEDKIIANFPKLFNKTSCIECGDGWFDLIYTLCKTIQDHIDHKMQHHAVDHDIQLTVLQCKEKFGGLRFYFMGGDDYTGGMIHLAENMSYKICQGCGVPGKLHEDRWWRVHCEKCENEWQERRSKA